MLILQRRLPTDGGRWRSVIAFAPRNTARVYEAVRLLASVCPIAVQWRLVRDTEAQEQVAIHDGQRWVMAQEADSPWWDSPHRRDSEWAAGDFETTIPVGPR